MALSIGVSVGSKVLVGEGTLEVLEITNGNLISVLFNGVKHLITEEKRVKIADKVFISCGARERDRTETYTRLAFEAPREIKIIRVQPVKSSSARS